MLERGDYYKNEPLLFNTVFSLCFPIPYSFYFGSHLGPD